MKGTTLHELRLAPHLSIRWGKWYKWNLSYWACFIGPFVCIIGFFVSFLLSDRVFFYWDATYRARNYMLFSPRSFYFDLLWHWFGWFQSSMELVFWFWKVNIIVVPRGTTPRNVGPLRLEPRNIEPIRVEPCKANSRKMKPHKTWSHKKGMTLKGEAS